MDNKKCSFCKKSVNESTEKYCDLCNDKLCGLCAKMGFQCIKCECYVCVNCTDSKSGNYVCKQCRKNIK